MPRRIARARGRASRGEGLGRSAATGGHPARDNARPSPLRTRMRMRAAIPHAHTHTSRYPTRAYARRLRPARESAHWPWRFRIWREESVCATACAFKMACATACAMRLRVRNGVRDGVEDADGVRSRVPVSTCVNGVRPRHSAAGGDWPPARMAHLATNIKPQIKSVLGTKQPYFFLF